MADERRKNTTVASGKMPMSELQVRARMRGLVQDILIAVRTRDWGEAAELDGRLKKCEQEIHEIRKEMGR